MCAMLTTSEIQLFILKLGACANQCRRSAQSGGIQLAPQVQNGSVHASIDSMELAFLCGA